MAASSHCAEVGMPLTVTYSIDQEFPKTVVPISAGGGSTDSDGVGFSNGGWVTSVVDTIGASELTFFNAAGAWTLIDFGFKATHGTLAQLTNGSVVAAGTRSGGGIDFYIQPTG